MSHTLDGQPRPMLLNTRAARQVHLSEQTARAHCLYGVCS